MGSYDFLFQYERTLARDLAPETLLFHRGDQEAFARKYDKIAEKAVNAGAAGVRGLAPRLLDYIAEAKNLKTAWNYLAARGGRAPGADGARYSFYGDAEAWGLCRELGKAIRTGAYRPGPERIVSITKESGCGTRELRLPCIADRTVERGAVQILQPLLDPMFDRFSLGFRPGHGVPHAIATAEFVAQHQKRWFWVSHDVKDAFSHVPLARLMDILRKRLPDHRLTTFLSACLGSKRPGLRQGGPLSPLLLNVYLDHFLDRVWRKRHPDIPLIRYADDVLLLCADSAEAVAAEADLRQIVLSAGMHLKAPADEAIQDLSGGQTTTWMGFRAYREADNKLAIELAPAAWARLRGALRRAHERQNSQLVARQIVRGWLHAYAPCYIHEDAGRVCRRIVRTGARIGYEEIPSLDELEHLWRLAHARWDRMRKRVRRQLRHVHSRRDA